MLWNDCHVWSTISVYTCMASVRPKHSASEAHMLALLLIDPTFWVDSSRGPLV